MSLVLESKVAHSLSLAQTQTSLNLQLFGTSRRKKRGKKNSEIGYCFPCGRGMINVRCGPELGWSGWWGRGAVFRKCKKFPVLLSHRLPANPVRRVLARREAAPMIKTCSGVLLSNPDYPVVFDYPDTVISKLRGRFLR